MKLFISGSISSKEIPQSIINIVDKAKQINHEIIVGDAPGIDKNIQDMLSVDGYMNVSVYHVGMKPRNLSNPDWKVNRIKVDTEDGKMYKNGKFTRLAQMRKDKAMANDANYGLVIWQDTKINRFGKVEVSKGSLNNIYNLLIQNKKVGLYYVPVPENGVMGFDSLDNFEKVVIEKLVKEETRKYYYLLKETHEKEAKLKTSKDEDNNFQQGSFF